MKKSISISVNEEKLSAIEMYLEQKNTTLAAELDKYVEQLYGTKQPTCTATGVRTYTCSCGSSYTETIAAKGHSYVNKVVAPTSTEKGYTLHTCSVCGNSYKDSYVNPPELNADGWYYCDALPSDVSVDKYTIQYNNYYEKTQSTSPGSDWTNAGVVKNEWQNSGSQYTSAYDLATSDSRVLISSIYYHFCGPNAGDVGNYEQSGNFVHYDWISASRVTSKYIADDNGHPYYLCYWPDGSQVYCKTGDTCDGAWGTHGARCRAWYKASLIPSHAPENLSENHFLTLEKTPLMSSQRSPNHVFTLENADCIPPQAMVNFSPNQLPTDENTSFMPSHKSENQPVTACMMI